MLGTPGIAGERVAPVTAKALMWRALRRLHRRDRHRDMAGDDVGKGLTAAFVGNVNRLHANRVLEDLEIKMRDAAHAGGGIIHLLRDSAGVGDELGNTTGRDIVCNDQRRWRGRNAGNRIVLRERIKARRRLPVQGLADRKRVFRKQEGIAVRLRSGDMVPGEITIRSRPILHDHSLAERLLEVIRNLPGQGVGRAAGDKRDDQVHRTGGIRLCAGVA
jgi:hypothetical protein